MVKRGLREVDLGFARAGSAGGKRKNSAAATRCSVLNEAECTGGISSEYCHYLPPPLFYTLTHQPPYNAVTTNLRHPRAPEHSHAHTSRSRPNEYIHACHILITRHSARLRADHRLRPDIQHRRRQLNLAPTAYLQPQKKDETLFSSP